MNKTKYLPNFINHCMTIGEIPTSYKNSMTYEEQLFWFCKFLEEQVIPTVNNNSEVVSELQTYIENYFNNLDVQEEINNKLNEMLEDGTLEEIITSYLQIKGMLCFNNVQEMKEATNLINGSFVKTYGFHNINDFGSAFYKIRNITNNDIVDNATIISLENYENLIAELVILNNEINFIQFGALGNSEENTTEIINCLKYAKEHNLKINLLNDKYLINDSIEIDNIEMFDGEILQGNIRIVIKNKVKCKNVIFNSTRRDNSILLENTNNLILDNCKIYGGIRCITHAFNTLIRNCYFEGYGYHILFNDNDNERTYTDPLGENIIVENCEFNINNNQHIGDIIEINTPNYRFNKIQIKGNIAYIDNNVENPTPYSPSSIGFGFANCDNITIINNKLDSVSAGNGAIHCEWCKNVVISNNEITNSRNLLFNNTFNALMLIFSENVNVISNIIKDYPIGIMMVSDLAFNKNYTISNNYIKSYRYGIYGNNAKEFIISNNNIDLEIVNNDISTSLEGIVFYPYQENYSLENASINNNIIKTSVSQAPSGNYSYGIRLTSYNNVSLNNNFNLGMSVGANAGDYLGNGFKHSNIPSNNSKLLLTSPNVQGYYSRNNDTVILDSTNGIFYKWLNDKWEKSLILFPEDNSDFSQTSNNHLAVTVKKQNGKKMIYNGALVGSQLNANQEYTLMTISQERARPLIPINTVIKTTTNVDIILNITSEGVVKITPLADIVQGTRPSFNFTFI